MGAGATCDLWQVPHCELRAQIDTVADAGLAPTHLDWHCLAGGGRADIFDLAMTLAQEYGLAARAWLDDGRRKARERGKPVVDNTFLDSFSIGLRDKPAIHGTSNFLEGATWCWHEPDTPADHLECCLNPGHTAREQETSVIIRAGEPPIDPVGSEKGEPN